jgi:phosphoribosyl 1,2-cyclic phosphodiesterase
MEMCFCGAAERGLCWDCDCDRCGEDVAGTHGAPKDMGGFVWCTRCSCELSDSVFINIVVGEEDSLP